MTLKVVGNFAIELNVSQNISKFTILKIQIILDNAYFSANMRLLF